MLSNFLLLRTWIFICSRDVQKCSQRHTVFADSDEPKNIPKCGVVKVRKKPVSPENRAHTLLCHTSVALFCFVLYCDVRDVQCSRGCH